MYRIGSNDTLGSIAQKHLGRASRWSEIYRLNRNELRDPDHLKIGKTLRLPSDASSARLVERPGYGR